jgi:hypothetical protein
MYSRLFGVAAALVSVGAGIYLLTSGSASEETTVFDALMHGIGAYFIARGLWMLAKLPPALVGERKPVAPPVVEQPTATDS